MFANHLSRLNAYSFCFSQVDRLKAELMYERRTSEEQLSRFEDERMVWQEEKEKVKITLMTDFLLVSFIAEMRFKA